MSPTGAAPHLQRNLTGFREGAASAAAMAASWASRALRRGNGEINGGRIALKVAPSYLASLSSSRTSILVTGTNGKSTVTSLTAAALGVLGPVASNRTGANMPDGIVTALRSDRAGQVAALEVDEVYLGPVVKDVRPSAITVLNLSREYTRGISLARTLNHWREVAQTLSPDTAVVLNVDDPLVQFAFEDAPRLIPVAGGLPWTADAVICPGCGGQHDGLGDVWSCPQCGRQRIDPEWWANGTHTVTDLAQQTTVHGLRCFPSGSRCRAGLRRSRPRSPWPQPPSSTLTSRLLLAPSRR